MSACSAYDQTSAKDNNLSSCKVVSLKRQVWDLEEVLKVKDEVISASTAAVGLASAGCQGQQGHAGPAGGQTGERR